MSCTASLSRGSGQCNSCNTRPHCLGAVGSGKCVMRGSISWRDGEACLGGGRCPKSGPPATHTATLPGRRGQWDSSHALPHCLAAVGSAILAIHCHTAWGQWAVEILHRTATPLGRRRQWNSCHALPHSLGAVGSASHAIHGLTALGQWAVELLQYTASLPGGSGQWNSCNGGKQFPTARAHQPRGTGSPAQAVVAAQGGPAGGSSSQRRGHTSRGGWGVLSRRWLVLKEGMRGEVAPNGAGTPAWGEAGSCLGGDWCSRRACRGQWLPTARAHQHGGMGNPV